MLVCNKYTLSMTKYLNKINSFFMIMVEQGNLSWIKILHSQGYDIRFQNDEALKIACKYGYLEIVKYLHSHGCDIMTDNKFCLKIASKRGHLEIVKYLYQNGYQFSDDDKSIINIASNNGHFEIVKYIRLLIGKLIPYHFQDYIEKIMIPKNDFNMVIYFVIFELFINNR
nr:ankyrin repeat domain containing protein [Mimivirus sp.]